MSKKKTKINRNLDPMKLQGHKLRSRRDFLAQGYMSMSCAMLMPSLLSMISSRYAYGLECGMATDPANRMTPFIILDLAGGANFAGSNVIVGKQNGQKDFLTDYSSLGLPADMHPSMAGQMDESMGLAFHADSGILRGINAVAEATTIANVDGAIFCTSSSDDTRNNPHNPAYWINKAGLGGELVNLIGTEGSDSGGRSLAPAASINPAARPAQITRPEDALGLVSLGKLATLLDPQRAEMVMKAAEKMSSTQLMKFQQKDLPEQVRDLVRCGYIQSADMINKFDANALDPRQDTDVNAIFDLTSEDEQQAASIAKLVIDGSAGAGTITLGGYDYHNGSRATGEQRDEEAGQFIGKMLQLAAAKQSDLAIYVFTDGSVASNGQIDNSANGRGKGIWRSDSGQRSSAFMLVYKDGERPEVRNGNRQIGWFKEGGAVENSANVISSNVENLAKAVTLNYLALHGKEGEIDKVVGDNPFGSNLDQYLAFTKLR